jgi:hypothetical protein
MKDMSCGSDNSVDSPIPVFKSSIPSHLIKNLPDDERYLVEAVSKLENQSNWTLNTVIEHSKRFSEAEKRLAETELRYSDIDGIKKDISESISPRLNTLWDWKQYFTGKWAIIAVLAVIAITAVAKVSVEWLFKKFSF